MNPRPPTATHLARRAITLTLLLAATTVAGIGPRPSAARADDANPPKAATPPKAAAPPAAKTAADERPVRITGVVRDPDGKPVPGATVAPADGTGNSLTGDTAQSVPTAADGTFVITLPPSGDRKYNLVAHDGGHAQWRTWANGVLPPIRTTPGQEIRDVVITLSRSASVRGRVVDEAGKPLADREVRASAADRLENRYYDPTTTTDQDGNFDLRFIRPGDQFIEAAPFWLRPDDPPAGHSTRVTLKAGDTRENVNLTARTSMKFFTHDEQFRRALQRSEKAKHPDDSTR